jgi:putative transposase
VSPVLEGLIRRVCLQRDAEVLELTILPDRVHLRVAVDPQLGIHRLVKQIKAVSSGQLRQEFADLRSRLPTLWSNSYFVSTSGSESEARLAEYLEEQKESPTRRKSAVAAA